VPTKEQSLTAFFEKKKNGAPPNTNLIVSPQKFNAHLNELIINKKKNNNKPLSTNLLGFPKNKSRKNGRKGKKSKKNSRRN
jgi:hypothetical protein